MRVAGCPGGLDEPVTLKGVCGGKTKTPCAERFCAEKGIPGLARIPYDKDIGTLASEGFVLVRENETHRAMFRALLKRIFEEADREAATDSQR